MDKYYVSPILYIGTKLEQKDKNVVVRWDKNLPLPHHFIHDAFEGYLPKKMIDAIHALVSSNGIQLSLDRRVPDCCYPPITSCPNIDIRMYEGSLEKPYAFFAAFLHEMAHAIEMGMNPYKSNHGRQFQSILHRLLKDNIDIFPADLKPTVQKMIDIPLATRFSHEYEILHHVLYQWPCKPEKELVLDEIPIGATFKIQYNGWGTNNHYKKIEKSKSTWMCINDFTGKKRYIKGETIVWDVMMNNQNIDEELKSK